MYSEEMASACVHIMERVTSGDIIKLHGGKNDAPQFVNIGTGIEISIRDLAFLIKDITGFKGEVLFDPSRPDGTMRKLTDISVLNKLGFESKIGLKEGITMVYMNYLK